MPDRGKLDGNPFVRANPAEQNGGSREGGESGAGEKSKGD
jgi:hypothetical protein